MDPPPDSHPGAVGPGRLRPGEQPRTPPLPHAHLSSASARASAAAGPLGPMGPLGSAGAATKLPLLQPHPSSRPHPHPHPHSQGHTQTRPHPQQGHSHSHSHSLSQQQDAALGNPLTRPLVRGTGPNPSQTPSPPYSYQTPHARPPIASHLSASSSSSFASHNTLTPIAATPVTTSSQQHQYHQPLPQHHQHPYPPQHQQAQRDGSSGPVTPEDDVAAGDPNDPKKHRACESCRGLKVRCEPNPDGEPDPDGPNPDGPCKRCAKAGRTCVVIQPTRKRQKKTDNRVAELEKKIDALTATLQATQATRTTMVLQPGPSSRPGSSDLPDTFSPTTASARDADSVAGSTTTGASTTGRDWGRERSSSTAQRSPNSKNMSSFGTIDINVGGYSPPATGGGMKRKHGVSGPPGPPRPETPEEGPDIVDRGLLTMEQAETLFKRYTTQMAPHLPAVVFPADMTAADLRVEKPILFHAVMAVSSSEITSIQRALTKELMQVFAESIVIIGRKSLELVQALHVAVIWYWPPEAFEELKFYQLVHIAAIMAIDIGLGRKSQANGGFRKHMPAGDHPLKKNTAPDPTTIEARRTWLACYFLATNTAMALHRPNLIRWTPFMADCVQVLESSDEAAPTDRYLTHLIWTHKLAEEVSVLLSMDDTSSTPNIADARTQYSLKGFERDLESYRESIPKELQQPSLLMSFNVLNLYMHEIATHTEFVEETSKTPFGADYPFRQPPPPSTNGGTKLTAAHVDAISECLAAIEGIFEVFLSMEATSIRCLPVYNFVRVAYAAVVLIKMYFAASSDKSALGRVINKDDIKVEQHLEKLLAKFKETAADDKSRPAAKFLVVLIMLHGWFQKQKYVLHGPAVVRPKGALAAGDRTQPPSSRESPEKAAGPETPEYPPIANTPLQLLSEVATKDSAALNNNNNNNNPNLVANNNAWYNNNQNNHPPPTDRQPYLYSPPNGLPSHLSNPNPLLPSYLDHTGYPSSSGPDPTFDYDPTSAGGGNDFGNANVMDWSGMDELAGGAGGFGMMQDGVRYMMQEPPWFGPLQQMGIPLNGLPGMHMMVPVDGMGVPLGGPPGGRRGGMGGRLGRVARRGVGCTTEVERDVPVQFFWLVGACVCCISRLSF